MYIRFLFETDLIKAIKISVPNLWALLGCKNGNLYFKKNTKNQYLQNCKSVLKRTVNRFLIFVIMTQFKN